MKTIVLESRVVHIPSWVVDLSSFRRWYYSEEFPEFGRISYLRGGVMVDMNMEQFFSHNQVKSEYNVVLGGLVKTGRLGRWVPDGMRLTNTTADLSCQPDGVFVSWNTLDSGRVRLIEAKTEGCLELEGSPDMLLEIVSPSSVSKDTEILMELYWVAGITEYWLVDVRGDKVQFDIHRHGKKGYTPVRKQEGWLRSSVFGRSFKLIRSEDERGDPEFSLNVK